MRSRSKIMEIGQRRGVWIDKNIKWKWIMKNVSLQCHTRGVKTVFKASMLSQQKSPKARNHIECWIFYDVAENFCVRNKISLVSCFLNQQKMFFRGFVRELSDIKDWWDFEDDSKV